MGMSFAGIPLLLQDPEGTSNQFVRRHLDERMASIFTPNLVCLNDGRNNARNNTLQGEIQQVGLPVPTYPPQPKPRINTLYWPTGACRWSQGLFLIDGYNMQQILQELTTSGSITVNSAELLSMTTPENGNAGVEAAMYLLPPRPVSPSSVDITQRLWILPLVDARYFWQNMPVLNINYSSWNALFASLASSLGIELYVDPIAAVYGVPDPIDFKRKYDNAAMLLDAAAATIGMRVVVDWSAMDSYCGGTAYQVLGYTSSATEYAANKAATGAENVGTVAGGEIRYAQASMVPGFVAVTFRNNAETSIANVVTVPSLLASNDPSQTKYFHTTVSDENRVPSSYANNLANQIARDYYGWLVNSQFDIDLPGMFGWHATGYDDFALWEYGVRKDKKAKHVGQTRIQSLPYNFGHCNIPLQQSTSSSSSSSPSSSSGSNPSSSSSVSGSGSSSSSCGCVTVVTAVSCSSGGLSVTYGSARGCC